MSLTKEQMREYQRRRRSGKKEKVGGEPVSIEVFEPPIRNRWGEGVPVYLPPTEEEKAEYARRVAGVDVLNECDRTFELARPLHYKFGKESEERICALATCSRKFKTRLELNRFCCLEHQLERLKSFSTVGLG